MCAMSCSTSGTDSQIEVRLGSPGFGEEIETKNNGFDQLHQSQNGQLVSYFDVGQANRTVIGLARGAELNDDKW